MRRSYIAGTGMYVPERVVTNKDLEQMMDTSDEWIRERSGIQERRFVEPGTGPADLAVHATNQALENAGCTIDDVELIIFATLSPEHYFPGSGVYLGRKLGLRGVGALDVRNQCSGFIYGLSVADQYVKSGTHETVLLIGAEVHSVGLNLSTEGRDVAVLFGDGAGAAVIRGTEAEDKGILSTHLHADGKYADELWVEAPTTLQKPWISKEMIDQGMVFPKMNGRQVFKHAITRFPEVIRESLEANGYTEEDLDMVVPHQANFRITEAIAKRLNLSEDQYMSNIHKYGNTTAASIPIALHEAVEEGRISKGDLVSLAAFGSGFTWAAALMRW
ncbi:MAG: ketoacyl-ACP synthase III [Candidatus Marinimicrobia bacterium]|nr:ketoacyl-ACP synthase III [Candidatus Neomarinimicrobiota bacterium]MCF7830146.1 ketoacyl-ACP synthase III [Candidatus Neomarinimicrobiota bacterium]MCF7882223.1 ketoacyl-ACP synthase III [Candidatus Neomarinimicrobiota bacterium]